MSDRLKALREKRGTIVKNMRDLTDKAASEKRDLTAEELKSHDAMFNEVDGIRQQILAEERTLEAEREAVETRLRDEASQRDAERGRSPDPTLPSEAEKRAMKAFNTFLRTGKIEGEGAEELRQLQASKGTEGGYIVAPQQFVTTLIKNVDDLVWIRQRAFKQQLTSSESLGAPSLDADPADADWTSELGTGSEDSTMAFGKRELRPHPVAKRIKVSKKLLRISALPVDALVIQRLAYKFAITEEKAYLVGDGNKKPLGVFVASTDGIPTSRDVSTGNKTNAPTFDGLIEAKMSLKAQYWGKSDWLFHRDAVKQIMKLKDGDGQYMWRMSVRDGEPDTLLGRPLMISEYAPNTFTTGQYVGIIGDFSQYWIADALDMQVQHLVELYAETNQDGFIGRKESDGAPVLAEAFARVKLA